MSLKWKLRQWNNPADKDAPKKFYAVPVWDDVVDERKLSEKTAKPTSLMSSDVTAVLDSLFDLLPELLMDGDIVTLGRLGKMKLTFSSDGHEAPGDVSSSDIKNVHVTFMPSTDLKRKIVGVPIKKYDPKVTFEFSEETSKSNEEMPA